MIKTYLGLPTRISGLKIARKEYAEFSESFPRLLDALETHAAKKLDGIDLGEVEWYHRLRNELYHQGNGLTVERRKVEVYSELAKILFRNLYGIELIADDPHSADPLAVFMNSWVDLERRLHALAAARGVAPYPRALVDGINQLLGQGALSQVDVKEFQALRDLRNRLVHGQIDIKEALTKESLGSLKALLAKIPVDAPRSDA